MIRAILECFLAAVPSLSRVMFNPYWIYRCNVSKHQTVNGLVSRSGVIRAAFHRSMKWIVKKSGRNHSVINGERTDLR